MSRGYAPTIFKLTCDGCDAEFDPLKVPYHPGMLDGETVCPKCHALYNPPWKALALRAGDDIEEALNQGKADADLPALLRDLADAIENLD